MSQVSLTQYINLQSFAHPLWIGSGVLIYDLSSGKTRSNRLWYDYIYLVGSSFATNILNNLLLPDSISDSMKKLIRSLITGLVYGYLYTSMISPKLGLDDRSITEAFVIGALSDFVLGMVSNPISSLWGY